MAKKLYTGINDTSRNSRKFYIGIADLSRNAVKAYIGVDNLSRQFWPSGGPVGDWLKDRMYLDDDFEVGQTYDMEFSPFEDVLGYVLHKLVYLSYYHIYYYGDYEHIEDIIQALTNAVVTYCNSNGYLKDRFRNNPVIVGAGFTGSDYNYTTLYVEIFVPRNSDVNVSNVQITNKTNNYEGIEYYETNLNGISCTRVFCSANIAGGVSSCSQLTRTKNIYVGRESWYKVREYDKSIAHEQPQDSEHIYFPLYYIQASSLGANFEYTHYFEDRIYYKWKNFGGSIYDLTDDIALIDAEHATIQNNGILLADNDEYVEFPNNVYSRTDSLVEISVNKYKIENPVDGAVLLSFWNDRYNPRFAGLRWYDGQWRFFNVVQESNRYVYKDDPTGITDINYFSGKKIGIAKHTFVFKRRPQYDQYYFSNQLGIRLYVNRRLTAESYYIPAPEAYNYGTTMQFRQDARSESSSVLYYSRWYLGSPDKSIGSSFSTLGLSITDISIKSLYLYHGIPDYKANIAKYQVGQTYTFNLADMEETWDYAVYAYTKIQDDYGTGDWLYRTPFEILNSGSFKDAIFEKINNYSIDFNAVTLNILGSGIDYRPREEDSSYIKVRVLLDRFNSVQGTILEKSNIFGFDYCRYQYVTSHRYYMEATIRVSATSISTTISDIGTNTNGNIYVGVYGYEGAGGRYYPYISLSNIGLDLQD